MKFSVITPSFRQLDWLDLCARSIADQASPSLQVEHLVQDACSPGIDEWARRATGELARPGYELRMVSEPDAGMYDAVNKGLRRAGGDICAYLNCDEQYLPGALAKVARIFEEDPAVEVVFGDAILVREDGTPLAWRRIVTPSSLHTRTCHLGTLTCATFFRRSILERDLYFPPEWKALGDAAWVCRLIDAGLRMRAMRAPTSAFTFTGANLGTSPAGRAEASRWKDTVTGLRRHMGPWASLHHRIRKWLAGAYSLPGIDVALYTKGSPRERKVFRLGKNAFGWADRRDPTR